jgi:hypothetical protein
MSKGKEFAFPLAGAFPSGDPQYVHGMTKLEFMATMIMAATAPSPRHRSQEKPARFAVESAKALLAELEKEEERGTKEQPGKEE